MRKTVVAPPRSGMISLGCARSARSWYSRQPIGSIAARQRHAGVVISVPFIIQPGKDYELV